MEYDNIRVKYDLYDQARSSPTGRTEYAGLFHLFLFRELRVPEMVSETKEQVRSRMTGELISVLEGAFNSKLSIEGLDKDAIANASGKYYIQDPSGFKVASIDYSCGTFRPDSQLEPVIEIDAAIELIVDGGAIKSREQYISLKDSLYKLSTVDMDWFFERESVILQERGMTSINCVAN